MEQNSQKKTQKTIKCFLDDNYSKPPKKKYVTKKTDVCHFDDNWSVDFFDMKKEYGLEKKP